MKNILLLIHDDQGQESRLQVALDVTRVVRGHLECLEVQSLPLIVADYYAGSDTVLVEAARMREVRNRKRIERRLASEDVPWSMREEPGPIADALSHSSHLADLIVVSSRIVGEDERRAQLETLPLKAERPILAVPPGCAGLNTQGCALIAWDGSRPCEVVPPSWTGWRRS